jgi:hypothetical protein
MGILDNLESWLDSIETISHVKKRDDIWVYENAFNDSEGIIDQLLKSGIVPNDLISQSGTITGKDYTIDSNTHIFNQLNKCVLKAVSEFAEFHGVPMEDIEDKHNAFSVRIYLPGLSMSPHTDTKFDTPEMVNGIEPFATVCLYLSENYEGGEIGFPEIDFYLKPKAGTLVIFKGNTLHEVKKLISGDRYLVMVGFLKKGDRL